MVATHQLPICDANLVDVRGSRDAQNSVAIACRHETRPFSHIPAPVKKLIPKNPRFPKKCVQNLHLFALNIEGRTFSPKPAELARRETRAADKLTEPRKFNSRPSVTVTKAPVARSKTGVLSPPPMGAISKSSFMMLIHPKNSDLLRITRIDAVGFASAVDGENELIPFLIRAIREIRGFPSSAQKCSNSRIDIDNDRPGAIKNRVIVSAPKNQPKMHKIQFIAQSTAAGAPCEVPPWPGPTARRIAAARGG